MYLPIRNSPRGYAWGSPTAIAELTGRTPTGEPEAELWLGTHPGSPARTADGRSLAEVAGELPYLLKLLAAETPLSLQAHPTTEQAEAGFARENALGIPVDSPDRNYRDARHKPEILYALSDPFIALSGFRPVAETRAVLALDPSPEVAALAARLTDDSALQGTFEWLIGRGEGVAELAAAVAASRAEHLSWEVARFAAELYPGDPGVAISLLLHAVSLRPGEVLSLPAGNVHAYVRGVGVELMAASDNVLRGGLTPKHVDIPELLAVLDFRPVPPPLLAPEQVAPGVRAFRPGVPDFALTVVDPGAATVALDGPTIALALGGPVELAGLGTLAAGEAAYLEEVPSIASRGTGTLFLAGPGRTFR